MITGILLAAGTSSRMGAPKQLLPWRGEPLVRHAARQALGSKLDGLIAVLGHEAAAVEAALAGLPLRCVRNEGYASGQASSLRAGLAALPSEAEAALVLLCDQPLVSPALIDEILAAFRQPLPDAKDVARQGENLQRSAFPVAVIPRYEGQRGNPVLLARPLFAQLMGLEGDEGARRVLGRHATRVRWLDVGDAAAVTDVDTLEEYRALNTSAAAADGDGSADGAD
jgi:molybdenum cofactor cytidylyltransferase